MSSQKPSAEATIKAIRRKTQRKYSAEEKIRIVIEGLRAEGIFPRFCGSSALYVKSGWSKNPQTE